MPEKQNRAKEYNSSLYISSSALAVIGWTALPQNLVYGSIFITVLFAIALGMKSNTMFIEKICLIPILSIIITTLLDIVLINKRIPFDEIKRNEIVSQFYLSDSAFLYNSNKEYYIVNDVIASTKWVAALIFLPLFFKAVAKIYPNQRFIPIKFWCYGVSISASFAIMNSLGIHFDFLNKNSEAENSAFRFSGLSSHPNHLATIVVMTLPLFFYLYKIEKLEKLGLTLILFLLTWSIILTGSRVGIVAFFIIFLCSFLYLTNRKFNGILLAVVLGFVIILIILPKISSELNYSNWRVFNEVNSASLSNQIRLLLAKQALLDFQGNPFFGIGPRAFKSGHIIYLQILASLGLLGFVAFTNLMIKIFSKSYRRNLHIQIAQLSISGILLCGLFSNALADFFLYVPLGIYFMGKYEIDQDLPCET